MTGTLGCKYWRMRSITKSVGQFWQLKQLQFFESKDGSGSAVTEDIEEASSSTYKDSPEPGQPDTSEYKGEKAVDGKDDTFWSSSADLKFEFVSVTFKFPKDIRSVKAQLTEVSMGPTMVIVEKSFDGMNWARSTEIADMKDWGTKLETYKLIDMDVQPPSVFALRSQENPWFCVGVKPKPNDDPQMPPDPLPEDGVLELQVCNDNTVQQYWQVDEDGRLLRNAANMDYAVHVTELKDGGALDVKKYECDGEDCPAWGATSKFSFSPEAKGGLIMSHTDNTRNLVFSAPEIKEGAVVTLGTCGGDGTTSADIANCADKTTFQFELKPMFLIEADKQALACAPYSHQLVEPTEAASETVAMQLCAAKGNCLAYNYAAADAECTEEPPCEHKYTKHVWLCTDLHEVHSGVPGWSLGMRAGRLEPFVEEYKLW
jgi:hypothetical protein